MEFNSTYLMEDTFGDVNEEIEQDWRVTTHTGLIYAVQVAEIIKLILCLCVIVTDILLIYVINKFNRLKSTASSYIKHYAICNILYYLSGPLMHLILINAPHNFCLEVHTDSSNFVLSILFAFGLGFDWLIKIFKPKIGWKIRNIYKYFILLLYILGGLILVALCILCINDFIITELVVLSVVYSLIAFFILILDYLNIKYKNETTITKSVYSLTIANVIFLSWLPIFIYHFLHEVVDYSESTVLLFWFTIFIPDWISCSGSIIIIILLVKMDKHFRMAFAKIFKRSLRNYSNDNESLDESEGDIDHPEINSNVVFNNITTCVKL